MRNEKKPYADRISEEFIKSIENGTAPWMKPWKAGTIPPGPINAITGRPYQGMNDMLLSDAGYSDPRWLTYKQATEIGGQVRKGEKSHTVQFWDWFAPKLDENGNKILDADGKPEMVKRDYPRVFFASVFNAEQIDNMPKLELPERTFDPVERAEELIASTAIRISHDQSDRAYYLPMQDHIHLPPPGAFETAEGYYSTALHELGHATGHETRLARDFGVRGTEEYAREELRAEIASFMVARDLGLAHEPGQHASYVKSWTKALENDKDEIFRAARDAKEIKHWIMEPDMRQSLEQAAQMRVSERLARTLNQAYGEAAPLTIPYIDVEPLRKAHTTPQPDHVSQRINTEAMAPSNSADPRRLEAEYFLSDVLNTLPVEQVRHLSLDRKAIVGMIKDLNLLGSQTNVNPATLTDEFNQILKQAEQVAKESSLHAELTSEIFDKLVPDFEDSRYRFEGYVSHGQRRTLGRQTPRADRSRAEAPAQSAERIYLTVPFAEKDAAKELGARWDKAEKSWFITQDQDRSLFAKWDTAQAQRRNTDRQEQTQTNDQASRSQRTRPKPNVSSEKTTYLEKGAELFWQAKAISLNASYADDQKAARNERENAASVHQTALVFLAQGTADEAKTAISTAGEKVNDPQLKYSVTYPSENELSSQRDKLPEVLEAERIREENLAKFNASFKTEMQNPNRIYLAVSYSERNEAKKLGARWDKAEKSWFITQHQDRSLFAKWDVAQAPAPTPSISPEHEFAELMRAHGFDLEKKLPVLDGQWHTVALDDNSRGKKSGAYKGFSDGRPSGFIHNYRTGETIKWVYSGNTLTEEQRAKLQAEAAQAKQARIDDQLQRERAASRKAYGVFNNLPGKATPGNASYLKAKGIAGHGTKVTDKGELVVPLYDAKDRLVNLQFFKAEGKRYLTDGQKKGAFHVITGDPNGTGKLSDITVGMGGTVLLCEGYATGASLHQATGRPVVVCLDASNLKNVAKIVQEAIPERERLICADNDHATKINGELVNVGINKAMEAAEATRSKLAIPEFTPAEKQQGLSDFNDLAQSRGEQAVKATILEALAPQQQQVRGIA